MKVFEITGPNVSRVRNVNLKEPGNNEVLIKVRACGICGTDIHMFKGDVKLAEYPIVPGHEFSGEVISVGNNVKDFSEGDRVAVDPNIACGGCYYCKMGMPNFCENWRAIGIHLQGACAEYVLVPQSNVYKMPENLSFEEAAFTEPVSCCVHGQDLLNLKGGESIAIFGLGPIGLIHAQLAKGKGASNIIGVDVVEYRIKFAESKEYFDHVINPRERNVLEEISRITKGKGVDVVIEASGSTDAFETGTKILGLNGKILVFGVAPEDKLATLKPFEIYRKQLSIIGSFINPFTTERALRMLSSGVVQVRDIISHEIELEEIESYYKKIEKKEDNVMKVMVKP